MEVIVRETLAELHSINLDLARLGRRRRPPPPLPRVVRRVHRRFWCLDGRSVNLGLPLLRRRSRRLQPLLLVVRRVHRGFW